MMVVRSDENFRASGPPPKALIDAIGQLGMEAAKAGTMVTRGGLHHSSESATVRVRGGKVVITDGPFTEAKEVIGGFTIFELPSMDEAKEQARRFMEVHRLHWPGWEGEVEIRPMYDDGKGPPLEGDPSLRSG